MAKTVDLLIKPCVRCGATKRLVRRDGSMGRCLPCMYARMRTKLNVPCSRCGTHNRGSYGQCLTCLKLTTNARRSRGPSVEILSKPCVRCGAVDRTPRGDCRPCARAHGRQHYRDNRERYFDVVQARNAAKLGLTVEPVRRSVVWDRDGGICHICFQSVSGRWDLDHVIPLSAGGAHSYANVAASHPRCNDQKGTADPRTDAKWAYLLREQGVSQ